MGEGVGSSEEATQNMNDFEIKISKVKHPSGLAAVEILGLMEACQVLVIGEDLDGEVLRLVLLWR